MILSRLSYCHQLIKNNYHVKVLKHPFFWIQTFNKGSFSVIFSGEGTWASICITSSKEYFLRLHFYHLCAVPQTILRGYNKEYTKSTKNKHQYINSAGLYGERTYS